MSLLSFADSPEDSINPNNSFTANSEDQLPPNTSNSTISGTALNPIMPGVMQNPTASRTATNLTMPGTTINSPQNIIPQNAIYISFSRPLVIRVKYVKPDQVKTLISSLIPVDQLKVDFINNMLVAVGDDDAYDKVREIVSQIDIPPRQIMFEAEAVEISREDYKNLGVDWGTTTALPSAPKYDTTTGYAGSPKIDGSQFRVGFGDYGVNFAATINHLIENKKGRLLASPRIATLDGQTATILIGDKLAVESRQVSNGSEITSVTYIDVGIKLEVTPTVNDDGTITTHIKPEVSNKTDTTKNGNPNIRTRQAETTLRVKDGETIVLGGLIQRQDTEDVFKTPLLGDLPIVGSLFRSKNKEKKETELVILITPKKVEP